MRRPIRSAFATTIGEDSTRIRPILAYNPTRPGMALSSIFDHPDREKDYSERVRRRIGTYSTRKPAGNVVMVTHNVNIAALTQQSVAPAEIVVVRPDGCCGLKTVQRLVVVGRT